jgi:hypothetical protein
MANPLGSFLPLLHLNASVKAHTAIAIPAGFAASALIFASLVYILVLHRITFFLRVLRR